MNTQVLEDCDRLAMEGKLSFSEIVARMDSVGVERYRADLVRMEKMHYAADEETHCVKMTLADAPQIAKQFNTSAIQAALIAIQTGKIEYGEFLRQIMSAGVAEYGVWLRGKVAIYFGRAGEFYVEKFPANN